MLDKDTIAHNLQALLPDRPADEIDLLAAQIQQKIAGHTELASVGESLFQAKLRPAIQIMLAANHSSIEYAAQYAIDVLVTQLIEDPSSTIPATYRGTENCPYPGLSSFDERRSTLFFGRDDDIARALAQSERPLLAITGSSGVGKSSLVSAGLIPALREAHNDNVLFVTHRLLPGTDILDGLVRELSVSATEEPSAVEALRTTPGALGSMLVALRPSETGHIYLVIDQFEELFVGDDGARAQDRRHLIKQLLAIDAQPVAGIHVILAMRRNFFDQPDYARHPRMVEVVEGEAVRLDPLTDTQLQQAIEQPLAIFNATHGQQLRFQDGLVDLIIQTFHQSSTSSLPLVQYLLRLLWVDKYHLTHFAYNVLGGLEGALERHARRIYASFSDEEQPLVKGLLVALVRPGLAGEHTRKRVRREELLSGPHHQELAAILRTLTNEQNWLLSEDRIGEHIYVELTHEVLLRRWPFLAELIDARKERIEERERLLAIAELWEQTRAARGPLGDPSYLYHGSTIKRADAFIANTSFHDEVDTRIVACYEASLRRQRTMHIRYAVGSLLALAVAVLIYLGTDALLRGQLDTARQVAEREQQRADQQQTLRASLSLARSSEQAQALGEAETALLLAIEGALRQDSSAANAALRQALEGAAWQAQPLALSAAAVRELVWSPDGQTLLVVAGGGLSLAEPDGTLRTGCASRSVAQVAWRPDSAAFASGGHDGTITIWQADNCADIATLRGHGGRVTSMAWRSDGARLVSGAEDGTVRLWNAQTGEELNRITADDRLVRSVDISPDDGRVLATTSKSVHMWWYATDAPPHSIPTTLAFDARWSADSQRIIVDDQIDLRLFDGLTFEQVAVLSGSSGSARTALPRIALSPDRTRIATLSGTSLRVWDAVSGREQRGITGLREGTTQVLWAADGLRVLTAGGGTVQIWDTVSGDELAVLPVARAVANWSPDGSQIATASAASDDVRLWRLASGQARIQTSGHSSDVLSGEWSPDGRMFASVSKDTVNVWGAADGRLLRTITESEANLALADWSPDSARLLVIVNQRALIYDAVGESPPLDLTPLESAWIADAHWSDDGRSIVALWDGGLYRWDALTGRPISSIPLKVAQYVGAAVSPDGRAVVITAVDQPVAILDADSGAVRALLTPEQRGRADRVVWSPDSRQVVLVNGSTATVWSAADGSLIATLAGQVGYGGPQWNRAGTQLLATDGQRQAHIWDAATGQVVTSLRGPAARLTSARWSADETRVLTTADDDILRVWSVSPAAEIYAISTKGASSVAALDAEWSPDGSRVLVWGTGLRASVYAIDTADLIAIGACVAGRPLSDEEIQRYSVPLPLSFDFTMRRCPPRLPWEASAGAAEMTGPVPTFLPAEAPTASADDLHTAIWAHFNDYGENRRISQFCQDGDAAIAQIGGPASSMFSQQSVVLARHLGTWSVIATSVEELADPAARERFGIPADFACLDPARATMVAVTSAPGPRTAVPVAPTALPPTPGPLEERELATMVRRSVGTLSYQYEVGRVCQDGDRIVGMIEPLPGAVGERAVASLRWQAPSWTMVLIEPLTDMRDPMVREQLMLPEQSLCWVVIDAQPTSAGAASASDPPDDATSGLVDITGVEAVYAQDVLTATFTLRELPAQVPYNQTGLDEGTNEYDYSVYIFQGGPSLTGATLPSADYQLSSSYSVRSVPAGEASLARLLDAGVFERTGERTYTQVRSATVMVDAEAQTITVVGRLPDIAGARLMFVALQHDGPTVIADRVDVLLK